MGVSLSLSIKQNSQSIENNTSNVTVNAVVKWTQGSYNATGECYGSITIDGTKYSFTNLKFNPNSASLTGTKTIMTKTLDISHDAVGEKTLSCSASFYTGLSAGTVKATASKVLTTIPRATTPTISGTLSFGSTVTVSTAGRASTDFTHRLYYAWGTAAFRLIADGVTTTATWTIPKTLAENFLAGTSGTVYLRCVTYNGSTVIGTVEVPLTISVPDTAEFRPIIQSVSIEEAVPGPVDRYVVGKSQLKITVSAVGGYVDGSENRNSYPVRATVSVDGVSYNVTLGQTASQVWSVTTNLLTKAGNIKGIVTVTDSRERSVASEFSCTVYEYSVPTISSFTAKRCLEDGSLDDSGEYVSFGLKTTVSSIDNQNAKTFKITYESGGKEVVLESGTLAQYTDNVLSYNSYSDGVTFSVDSSWVVRAYVYDSFNTDKPAVIKVIVPTEATFMDWRENGKGWAFGKVSTRDGLEIAWPIYDRFGTLIDNGLTKYTGSGDAAIDPNTTLEHLILTDKNTPAAGFWYIETNFYSTKSDTANCVQIAFPYSDVTLGIYVRCRYNKVWSEWEMPGGSLDKFYPVNSVVIRFDHVSPASLFGGTWTRVIHTSTGAGAFLYGATDAAVIGEEGGEAAHTLTESELPKISGSVQIRKWGSGNMLNTASGVLSISAVSGDAYSSSSSGTAAGYQKLSINFGGGAAHSNIPPFVKVSIWRRTA